MVQENIVKGRKYRKLIDETQKIWQRISFWSAASDTECEDGETVESKIGALKGITSNISAVTTSGYAADALAVKNQILADVNSMKTSFQAGVDSVYNAIKNQGTTPSSKTLSDIVTAISTLATNKYNAGVTAADARTNTSSASYKAGVSAADNRVNTDSASYKTGYTTGYSTGGNGNSVLVATSSGNAATGATKTLPPGTYKYEIKSGSGTGWVNNRWYLNVGGKTYVDKTGSGDSDWNISFGGTFSITTDSYTTLIVWHQGGNGMGVVWRTGD